MRKLAAWLLMLVCLVAMLPRTASAEEVGTSALACVVIDEKSGRVLLSHNAEAPLPMASTTKVMTALLALESGDLEAPVTCSRNAFGVPGTSIYLSEGETLTLRDMLYGLMLASGNDAATAIAEHIGGSVTDFCAMMTARAAELGCKSTVFRTPHGLPCDGHYTTAHDLALIAREAMTHPEFREIVGTSRATIPWEGRGYDRVLNNKNRLLTSYEGATGIKTGYTKKAGRCLVFGAEQEGMRIIGVVLNCWDWFDEAARLMDMAFERYEAVTMLQGGEMVSAVEVVHSDSDVVNAVLAADLTGVVAKGSIPQVEIDLPDSVEAPVQKGQVLGTARLLSGGVVVAESSLLAAEDVARDDFPARWQMYWHNWLGIPQNRVEASD
ncbi:MAG: D-alanyl-D-alanine carboxypeptidase family protein [Aristaeellaceae bacterium]